jgi:hypothetical protein
MGKTTHQMIVWGVGVLAGLLVLSGPVAAADVEAAYPEMAPLEQYMMSSPTEEVALARSAAPESISGAADVLTLGRHGYETAVHGHNGFVCLVERSWGAGLDDPGLWNQKIRAPICLNPAAVGSVLRAYLERTDWVLAGAPRDVLRDRTRRAVAARTYPLPPAGAMCFMLSKLGYLGDDARGPWHPHLMLFVPRVDTATWGANLAGSPVMALQGDAEPVTTFLVPVQMWSDGTADTAPGHASH